VLDLGRTPLANANVSPDRLTEAEATYPLQVHFCGSCGLVQLGEIVPPEILFRDYPYVTGASRTMVEHFDAMAASHVSDLVLGPDDLALEIASNDGTLLASFAERGVRTLGIEPAENLVDLARARGIESLPVFFGRDVARRLRAERGPAAVVCANNVLAHVPDLAGVLEGCRIVTEPRGVVSVEVPYLAHLLERLEYDTVYHEHLSYFSVRALADAFGRAGLAIFDVREFPVHGGSLRVLARAGNEHGEVVDRLRVRERSRGLEDLDTYRGFAARVEENRLRLRALLERLRDEGARVAAYGAPAKGNTLLNYCGIGTDLVAYTVDRNPLKVGTHTPGMRLPVREVEFLRRDRPDYTLILPWNIESEIMKQEEEYVRRGGRFIVPIPEPRIVP
jgi:SAM-dependent methyltransferase